MQLFQPLPLLSAVAGWMSSATHSIPRAIVAGGPWSLFEIPSFGMSYQAVESGIAMASQNAGSSRRPLLNPSKASQQAGYENECRRI